MLPFFLQLGRAGGRALQPRSFFQFRLYLRQMLLDGLEMCIRDSLEAEQTVQKAKGLQLTPAKATLYVGSDGVGESIALVALVRPEGADGALSWKSSKSAVDVYKRQV